MQWALKVDYLLIWAPLAPICSPFGYGRPCNPYCLTQSVKYVCMYTYLHVHCTVKLAKIRTVFEAALLLCNGLGKLILVLVVKCQGLSISRCRSLNLIVAIFRPLYYSMYSVDCQRCQKCHNLFVCLLVFVDAFKLLLNAKEFQSVDDNL